MNSQYSSIEELIQAEGKAIIAPIGKSMLPFLKEGRDMVLLKAPAEPLQKYDIVLYKNSAEGYILHRIIRVNGSDYIICGDNSSVWEFGHSSDDIIAVVDKIIRNGKQIDCHCFRNKIYEHIWCGSFIKRAFFKLKRILFRY